CKIRGSTHQDHELVDLAVALETDAEQPGPQRHGMGIDKAKHDLPARREHIEQLLQQQPDAPLHLRPNDHAEALDEEIRAAAAQAFPEEPKPPQSAWASTASGDLCQRRRAHQWRARRTHAKARHVLMPVLFAAWARAPKCEPRRNNRTCQDNVDTREATKCAEAMPPLLGMLRSFVGLLDTAAKVPQSQFPRPHRHRRAAELPAEEAAPARGAVLVDAQGRDSRSTPVTTTEAADAHFQLVQEVEDLFGDIFEDAQCAPTAPGDAEEGPVEHDLALDEEVSAEGALGDALLRGGVGAAGRSVREIGLTSREPPIPKRLSPKPRADAAWGGAGARKQAPAPSSTHEVNSERGRAQSPSSLLEPAPRCTHEVVSARGRPAPTGEAGAGATVAGDAAGGPPVEAVHYQLDQEAEGLFGDIFEDAQRAP
ncbi:unnamed protein product, partial [Prorocentrum cordatum]